MTAILTDRSPVANDDRGSGRIARTYLVTLPEGTITATVSQGYVSGKGGEVARLKQMFPRMIGAPQIVEQPRWFRLELTRLEEFTRWTHEGGQDRWTEWVHEEATVEVPLGDTPYAYAKRNFPAWSLVSYDPCDKPLPLTEPVPF